MIVLGFNMQGENDIEHTMASVMYLKSSMTNLIFIYLFNTKYDM